MWQKKNIDKLDFTKLKKLCVSKESGKSTHRMGENIYNHIFNKEPIFRTYKKSYNSN